MVIQNTPTDAKAADVAGLRIAVCMSGLQRFDNPAMTLFSAGLPGDVQVDYFCFLWRHGEASEEAVAELLRRKLKGRASTIRMVLSPDIDPLMDFDYHSIPRVNEKNVMRMYYAMEQANRLKILAEHDNGFIYDIVFRQRTDVAMLMPFDPTKYMPFIKNDIVLVPDQHNYMGFNDQFAVSSSRSMDRYASVYHNIPLHCSKGCLLHQEVLLRWHLESLDMEVMMAPLRTRILRS